MYQVLVIRCHAIPSTVNSRESQGTASLVSLRIDQGMTFVDYK